MSVCVLCVCSTVCPQDPTALRHTGSSHCLGTLFAHTVWSHFLVTLFGHTVCTHCSVTLFRSGSGWVESGSPAANAPNAKEPRTLAGSGFFLTVSVVVLVRSTEEGNDEIHFRHAEQCDLTDMTVLVFEFNFGEKCLAHSVDTLPD